MAKFEISELVKDKYRVKPTTSTATCLFKGANIDLKTIDVATLDWAVENGFDLVETIKAKEPKK